MRASLAAAGFFARLPFYLRRNLAPEQISGLTAGRVRNRKTVFLDRLLQDVYGRPGSTYAALLKHAGCEYGDIEASVRKDGLETALSMLFEAGVYLMVDEFKGRKPIRRGSLELETGPDDLRSPRAAHHFSGSSGASRGSGTPVIFDLRFLCDVGSNRAVDLHARGGHDWAKGVWWTAGARSYILQYAMFGYTPEAWFTQIDPQDRILPSTARWNTHATRVAGIVAGRPLPRPVYAPLSDPSAPLAWVATVLRKRRVPLLHTFPSSAVRLCLAARARGVDISGTHFLIGGEPVTDTADSLIRNTGCEAISADGSAESGLIGHGCMLPGTSDDMHLFCDLHGVIQAGSRHPERGLPHDALLLTSLLPYSPFLMLNVSMGDQGELVHRECGCPLAAIFPGPHLRGIASFEKLTTLGVTFLSTDLIPILERVLPGRFGGGPTDYQLVESECADGQPQLELRVDPTLGGVDGNEVLEEFCAAAARTSGSGGERIQLWRDAGTLRVVRQAPALSLAGKILHIHRLPKGQRREPHRSLF